MKRNFLIGLMLGICGIPGFLSAQAHLRKEPAIECQSSTLDQGHRLKIYDLNLFPNDFFYAFELSEYKRWSSVKEAVFGVGNLSIVKDEVFKQCMVSGRFMNRLNHNVSHKADFIFELKVSVKELIFALKETDEFTLEGVRLKGTYHNQSFYYPYALRSKPSLQIYMQCKISPEFTQLKESCLSQ